MKRMISKKVAIKVVEENIRQDFRLKNIDEIKNYFLKEIKQNELIRKKHKKICTIFMH